MVLGVALGKSDTLSGDETKNVSGGSRCSAIKNLGRNERLRVGIIGAGGRGRYLTAQFKELGADMAAVCDVYEPNLQAGLKESSTGAVPHRDYRKLLDDKSIDAVDAVKMSTSRSPWRIRST